MVDKKERGEFVSKECLSRGRGKLKGENVGNGGSMPFGTRFNFLATLLYRHSHFSHASTDYFNTLSISLVWRLCTTLFAE